MDNTQLSSVILRAAFPYDQEHKNAERLVLSRVVCFCGMELLVHSGIQTMIYSQEPTQLIYIKSKMTVRQ